MQRFHFVEYGLITFLFYRAWRPLEDPSIVILPALAALLVGTADEWLQWFIPNRVGELDDIFLNGIAIACGLVFSLGADPPAAFRRTLAARFRCSASAGSPRRSCSRWPLFFHAVHLGHDIGDEEIGVFKSRYSKDRLGAMAAEKLEEWRAHPLPLVLRRVSREDQYMSEGVTHVQERNEHLAAGDVGAAWKENRILEKYYAPVLDTPSYVSRTGHRWSPGQRADIEARLPRRAELTAVPTSAPPTRILFMRGGRRGSGLSRSRWRRSILAARETPRVAESGRVKPTTFLAALAHRLVILGLAVSAAAGLLPAVVDLVHRRPRAALGFVVRKPACFVALFDVLGLALLLVRVFALVSLRHRGTSV